MKKEVTNTWADGLNKDLHPIVTPNSVLTDNLNGTFITYNGNEFCLQNDRGNVLKTKLSDGFVPIGIKEHNGVLYIISCSEDEDGESESEIGTYPGVDWPSHYSDVDENEKSFLQEYRPLKNLKKPHEMDKLFPFRTGLFDFDRSHPVSIEIQDSYDGSINLILTDGKNPARIINTGFSVLPNNKYKLIKREGEINSNYYNTKTLLSQTRLITGCTEMTKFSLVDVPKTGQLPGGNYTFYLKYGDADANLTDVVAQSSTVSVFISDDTIGSVRGTLANERTDKAIVLKLENLDTAFNYFHLFYIREYSDTNGFEMRESVELSEPYLIGSKTETITITGFETTTSISEEDLNIQFLQAESVKTAAQQQGMLFLGNIKTVLNKTLKNLSYGVKVTIDTYSNQDELKWVDPQSSNFRNTPLKGAEYYDVHNIYERVGYWPGEYYRFGIVYILRDGSTTQAYNVIGCNDLTTNEDGLEGTFDENGYYVSGDTTYNKLGIFKVPGDDVFDTHDYENNTISSIYFKFEFTPETISALKKEGIIGYFVVRQKRNPITYCQGITLGCDQKCGAPAVPLSTTNGSAYFTQRFLTQEGNLMKGGMLSETDFLKACEINIADGHNINNNIYFHETMYGGNTTDCGDRIYGYDDDFRSVWCQLYINNRLIGAKHYIADYEYEHYTDHSAQYTETLPYIYKVTHEFNYFKQKTYIVEVVQKIVYYDSRDNRYKTANETIYLQYTPPNETFREPLVLNVLDYNTHRDNYEILKPSNYQGVDIIQVATSNSAMTYNFFWDHMVQLAMPNLNILFSLDPCVSATTKNFITQSHLILNDSKWKYDNFGGTGLMLSPNVQRNNNIKTGDFDVQAVFVDTGESKLLYDEKDDNQRLFVSSHFGNASSVSDFEKAFAARSYYNESTSSYITLEEVYHNLKDHRKNTNLIRGEFLPVIALNRKLGQLSEQDDLVGYFIHPGIVNLKRKENERIIDEYQIRSNSDPYYIVSDRTLIDDRAIVFRGDCYTCTPVVRFVRNFIDGTNPILDEMMKDNWKAEVVDKSDDGNTFDAVKWDEINLSDVNNTPIGFWIGYKCRSNYNLALRSINDQDTVTMADLGMPRDFYPHQEASLRNRYKQEESWLLNAGYSINLSRKRFLGNPNLSYVKNEFSNRIIFSNKNVTDQFTNGYRVFQGASYQDYDKQYGEIIKLVPWGNNLFCAFEHGLALLPVNEKALLQTTTEQTIHIYGHGVLPAQMSIISQDYGTKFADSILRTPIGIYGLDVDAKKVWRFSDKQGFETLSDMKIESFLNQYLSPDYVVDVSSCDVRTHYNSFKGDVIFTWYNGGEQYSICFNERQSLWTTRYDWVPIVSENKNGEFYSLQFGEDSDGNVGIYSHEIENSRPTKWYGKQHPFEFEFVVSDPIGAQKIYENLQIISNNVQPEELQFEFIGDSYFFNKARIYHTVSENGFDSRRLFGNEIDRRDNLYYPDPSKRTDNLQDIFNKPNIVANVRENGYTPFRNASVLNDRDNIPFLGKIFKASNATEEYRLRIPQECRNIETWGRRLGNIHYKDGIWHTTIEPIIYDARLNDSYVTILKNPVLKWNSARIRDKWCKIRVRYSGEDLAVITAIKTIVNI